MASKQDFYAAKDRLQKVVHHHVDRLEHRHDDPTAISDFYDKLNSYLDVLSNDVEAGNVW